MRSTAGGIVALNMYVVRYACSLCSTASSSAGLSVALGMAASTSVTCGSKPRSIMRSASSSTT